MQAKVSRDIMTGNNFCRTVSILVFMLCFRTGKIIANSVIIVFIVFLFLYTFIWRLLGKLFRAALNLETNHDNQIEWSPAEKIHKCCVVCCTIVHSGRRTKVMTRACSIVQVKINVRVYVCIYVFA